MRVRSFVKQLYTAIDNDNITDSAAMMAYYAVMSLFPMIVFVGSLSLLVLPDTTVMMGVHMAGEALPPGVRPLLVDRVQALIQANSAGFAIVGGLVALWGASRGASGLATALATIYTKPETRSWLRRQAIAIVATLVVAVLVVAALSLLLIGPWIGHWAMDRFGLGSTFDAVWSTGRWVGAGLLLMFVWALLYKWLPNTEAPFHVFTPGAIVGVLAWLGMSALFGLYLQHFGSYDATYGTLGGAIIFLFWLWLSNIMLLVGAEINDVLADMRANKSVAAAQLADPLEQPGAREAVAKEAALAEAAHDNAPMPTSPPTQNPYAHS
ncbi:MAG: YihY/virulence factor BrkB family protein [Deltaproteobacteria bacterium]